MAEPRAYALKENLPGGEFAGGSIVVSPDSRLLDLKARLGDDGVIVTGDESEQAALDAHPALKSVPVEKPKSKGGDK